MIEEWQEEEKIVIKKPAPPTPTPPKAEEGGEEKKEGAAPVEQPKTEQDYETKLKKKSRSEAINFDT